MLPCKSLGSTNHACWLVLFLQVRDPAAGVFSAETMLRNMGVPLPWSLMDPLQQGRDANGHSSDPRFQVRRASSWCVSHTINSVARRVLAVCLPCA
jgi:hypothetical protein